MRYVPSLPAVIFDVGGGPGVYACWLAKQGYEVHLVDATPLHVELARQASQAQPDAPLASIEIGDACSLKRSDESCDVVLLFGPLYHLTERVDRLTALHEAHRVLRSEASCSPWAFPASPLHSMGCARDCLTIPAFAHCRARPGGWAASQPDEPLGVFHDRLLSSSKSSAERGGGQWVPV